MNPSGSPSPGLKPVVPVLDILLRIRQDMATRPAGPYQYMGMPDVDWAMSFILGYREVLHALGVEQGPDVLFGPWLRDVRQAWPGEGWEAAYLREFNGDQTRALSKYLDLVAEFRAIPTEALATLAWSNPEDGRHATLVPRLTPTRAPPSTLDFLLELRRDIGDTEGRLFLYIGPIQVKRMAGFIAGYRLCLALVGARDEEYVRFERWLHDEQGLPAGEEWPRPFLDASGGDPERAIRRLLDSAARFRGV
ncbi:MAG: hypothetical protein ABW123_14350 [Cystobacter sp.]